MEDDKEKTRRWDVLGIRRGKSHARLARSELGEGLGHLRQAASYAANGVGSSVGPKMRAAGGYVLPTVERIRHTASPKWTATMAMLAPLAAAGARSVDASAKKANVKKDMRMMQKKGKKPAAKRRPMMIGLLAMGAMAGAAMALRRRRHQQEWEEYIAPTADITTETDTIVVAGGLKPAKSESAKPGAPESAKPAGGATTGSQPVGSLSQQMATAIKPERPEQGAKPSGTKPTAPGNGVIGGR